MPKIECAFIVHCRILNPFSLMSRAKRISKSNTDLEFPTEVLICSESIINGNRGILFKLTKTVNITSVKALKRIEVCKSMI